MEQTWIWQMLGTGLAAAVFNQGAQLVLQRWRETLASRSHALSICVLLEAYAIACAEAAADLAAYLRNPEHESEPSCSLPVFGGLPESIDVRYLPLQLSAQVLNFPLVVSFHGSYLGARCRYSSSSEYEEYALEEVALVGYRAHRLAGEIARAYGFRAWAPELPDWDFAATLEAHKRVIRPDGG